MLGEREREGQRGKVGEKEERRGRQTEAFSRSLDCIYFTSAKSIQTFRRRKIYAVLKMGKWAERNECS